MQKQIPINVPRTLKLDIHYQGQYLVTFNSNIKTIQQYKNNFY